MPHPIDAWVAYLDVWGFSSLVRDRTMPELLRALNRCHAGVAGLCARESIKPRRFVLSDSTFLCYPVKNAADKAAMLEQCVSHVEQITAIFLNEGLPIRGAIAFGSVHLLPWLLVGEPVIRAVKLEQIIPFPVVLVSRRECEGIDELAPKMKLVNLKEGQVMHARAIWPRPLDEYRAFVENQLKLHAKDGPFNVAGAWNSLLNFYLIDRVHPNRGEKA